MASWSSSSSGPPSTEVTEHNRQLLKELKKGDLVEFPRKGYSHWAVYVGNGQVVHLTIADGAGSSDLSNPDLASPSGVLYSKGVVKKENLLDVAGASKAKKNNSKDSRYQYLSQEEIVSNALGEVGTKTQDGYNVLEKNCEHFASWCRYGEAVSDQAETAKFITKALGIALPAAVTGLFSGARFVSQ